MSHLITINGDTKVIASKPDDSVLLASLRSGIGFPYECNAGSCGSCKYELLEGRVESLCTTSAGLTARDVRKNIHLGCQTRALSDLKIKTRIANEYVPTIPTRKQRVRWVETTDVTHDIKEFVFRSDGPAEFCPGQYAILTFPKLGIRRAYSMSNLDNEEGEWRFMIRYVPGGEATNFLFHGMDESETVELDAPYGMAYIRENPRKIVCVAGGSGLAPMLSIAKAASRRDFLKDRSLEFFYGGRSYRDVGVDGQLRSLPEFGTKILFHPVVSEQSTENIQNWAGEFGFVHESVEKKLGGSLKDCEFYFAGPPAMTRVLQETLMLKHQVPFHQIHFDRFF